MILNIFGGEVEIDSYEANKIILKELNKLSKGELINLLMDRDGEYLDLEEYFREEITEQIKPDCIRD